MIDHGETRCNPLQFPVNFPVIGVSCIFPEIFFVHKLIQFAGPYLAAKGFNDKTAGEWHESSLFSLRNLSISSPPPPLSRGVVLV